MAVTRRIDPAATAIWVGLEVGVAANAADTVYLDNLTAVFGPVSSSYAPPGLVMTAGLADAAVIGAKIASATMQDGNFAANTIHGNKIIDGSIFGGKIQAGTIGTGQIADGQLTTADLGADTISMLAISSPFSASITNPPNTWLHPNAQVVLNGLGGAKVLVFLFGYVTNNTASVANYVGIGDNTNTANSTVSYIMQNPGVGHGMGFTAVYGAILSANHTFYGVGGVSGGTGTFSGQMLGIAFHR